MGGGDGLFSTTKARMPRRGAPAARGGSPCRPATRSSARRSSRPSRRRGARAVRHGLLLGSRARLLAGARGDQHLGRLRRRLHPEPTYEEVCSGRTGYNEVVRVCSTPPYELRGRLRLFWESHDPTQGMRQGNDVGTQYRSAIYTYSDAQREAAQASREAYGRRLPRPATAVTTEIGTPRVLLRRGLPPAVPGRRCRTATAAWAAPGVSCPVGCPHVLRRRQ